MNRIQFIQFVKDVHEHPERLSFYRKKYKNIYPFSDGIFKILMASEGKQMRLVKFLNAMLGLKGRAAIKEFTLGVPENPGVLNDKTAIFDIYGTTQANEPVLIEIQQNYNRLFVDRLIYYTSRVISRTVKKAQDYKLPHIYVLSILTDNQFKKEKDRYFHHMRFVRNEIFFYKKLDIFFVEVEKFFKIEDATLPQRRERTDRAEMLRIFRAILEEKDISEEKLIKFLDSDFAKDVSMVGYTDEILLNEVDGMTDILYEKQGSFLDGQDAKALEVAHNLYNLGKLTPDEISEVSGVPVRNIRRWKRKKVLTKV